MDADPDGYVLRLHVLLNPLRRMDGPGYIIFPREACTPECRNGIARELFNQTVFVRYDIGCPDIKAVDQLLEVHRGHLLG